ncbi:hypothetical protein C4J81_13755 [Deltaproteobacteria bacterium Smac51]|nr:hypothetical protein C4J81_13755 [Deltaproteobacteria bacterium Smac51]
MLSPHYIAKAIPNDLWDRYVDVEHEIIMACARMLKDAEMLRLWVDDGPRAEMLLSQQLDQIVSRHWNKAARGDLKKAFQKTAEKALASDESRYRRAYDAGLLKANLEGSPPEPIIKSWRLKGIRAAGYKSLQRRLDRANRVAKSSTLDALRMAINAVGRGEASIEAALRQAVNELAAGGVTGYRYPSGREVSLAPYVRQIVITEVMNATRQQSNARAEEWGSDLIIVSSHAGARPKCFPYQGRVFVRDGGKRTTENAKYPMLKGETSYEDLDGLFGINCRHFSMPWFEGLNDEYTEQQRDPAKYGLGIENDELYDLTQKQRYNERQIRKWKLRADELKVEGADDSRARRKVREARAKVRGWQKRQRDFLNEPANPLRRDYSREAA